MEEDKRKYTMGGWLVKEKIEAGYDIEIPSLGVVIPGDKQEIKSKNSLDNSPLNLK